METRTLGTIYKFCADYHSGQWSRGYRLLSIIGIRLNKLGITHPIDQIEPDYELYASLVRNYRKVM